MSEIVWLTAELVRAFHAKQLKLFGDPSGLRDAGSLESALGEPMNRAVCGEPDLAALAAAYAFGIAKIHPFVDGNKQAALLTLVTFLGLNGIDFVVDEARAAAMIVNVAAGEISEDSLARWIRDNWPAA